MKERTLKANSDRMERKSLLITVAILVALLAVVVLIIQKTPDKEVNTAIGQATEHKMKEKTAGDKQLMKIDGLEKREEKNEFLTDNSPSEAVSFAGGRGPIDAIYETIGGVDLFVIALEEDRGAQRLPEFVDSVLANPNSNLSSTAKLIKSTLLSSSVSLEHQVSVALKSASPIARRIGLLGANIVKNEEISAELRGILQHDSYILLSRNEQNELDFVAPLRKLAAIALGQTNGGDVDFQEGIKMLDGHYGRNESIDETIKEILSAMGRTSYRAEYYREQIALFVQSHSGKDSSAFSIACKQWLLKPLSGSALGKDRPKDPAGNQLPPPPSSP